MPGTLEQQILPLPPAAHSRNWKAAVVSAHLLAQSLPASLGRPDLHFLESKLLPSPHGSCQPWQTFPLLCGVPLSLAEVKLILGVQEKPEACPWGT